MAVPTGRASSAIASSSRSSPDSRNASTTRMWCSSAMSCGCASCCPRINELLRRLRAANRDRVMTSELQAGTIIKNYVLQERLGRGASGEVWRAVQTGREAAIKFVNVGEEKYRKSLEAEVKALRKLRHPHIPALYDYDLR